MDIKNVGQRTGNFKTDYDEQRAGRTSVSDEMLTKVHKIMLEDRRMSLRELAPFNYHLFKKFGDLI